MQDEEEPEASGRRGSLIALAIMTLLLIAGVVLTHQLRKTSRLQDCLMTKATNCTDSPETAGRH
jgi:hypothetical protein